MKKKKKEIVDPEGIPSNYSVGFYTSMQRKDRRVNEESETAAYNRITDLWHFIEKEI